MEKIFNVESYKFKHPSSMLVSGISMSGKSTFTKSLIKHLNVMYSPVPSRIIVSYAENPEQYTDIKDVELIKGLDFESSNCSNEPTLIIIDDQMTEAAKNPKIQELFTRGVHHRNQSIIFITQNIYNQGKFARDMRLNVHYMVIFKSPTFLSQIMCLGRQLFPEKKHFLLDAYKKATERPFSYLYINIHPECEDSLRVRSGVLPLENEIIYTP